MWERVKLPCRAMDEIEKVRDNATGRYTGHDRAESEPEKVTVEHDKAYSPFVLGLIELARLYEESGFGPIELANVVTHAVNGPTAHKVRPELNDPPAEGGD